MRVYFFNSLSKLQLAKYSLVLYLQALLFAAIVRRLNYRMASRSSLATYMQNKNANCHYIFVREDTRISCNNKKSPLQHGNKIDSDDSLTISYEIKANFCLDTSLIYRFEKYTHMFASLKSGVLFINPYQDERYFGKAFLRSLFSEIFKTAMELTGEETDSDEKNTSREIYLDLKDNSKPYSKKSVCLVDEFSKDECAKNKRWATWKKSESDISDQSNNRSVKPVGLSELSIAVEKYFAKNESVTVKAGDNGFVSGNNNSTTFNKTKILKENKISTFETVPKPILSNTKYDATFLKDELALHSLICAIAEPQLSLAEDEYNIPKNVKLAFEEVISEQVSSNTQENFDRSKKERKTFTFKREPELSTTKNESKIMETGKFTFDKKFSKLILSIMQDDSNSDLKTLEDEVNCYHSSPINLFRSFNKSDSCSNNWNDNKVYNCDESLVSTTQKESSFQDSDISEGHYPMSKRTRVNSADSGISLDSNFEAILPESLAQESTCETLSHESISGLNSTDSLYVDDCYKVCQLCEMVILNNFFLSSRFGLLLNCFHSFCYPCIRNRSKSKRLGTNFVKCPKCGEDSPGIVSSPRWIKDTYEKMILFQEYEKESKFFNEQQQVFLNSFSVLH